MLSRLPKKTEIRIDDLVCVSRDSIVNVHKSLSRIPFREWKIKRSQTLVNELKIGSEQLITLSDIERDNHNMKSMAATIKQARAATTTPFPNFFSSTTLSTSFTAAADSVTPPGFATIRPSVHAGVT